MRGTTWKRGKTWTYQFAVPKGDGGRRFVTKGGFDTKKAAEAALAVAVAEHGHGPAVKVEPSKMALSNYLRDEWLPVLHGLKPSTVKGYRDLVEAYIIPHLGDARLCDLTAGRIASVYDVLRERGAKRQPATGAPRGLSESSVHHVHVVLCAALGHAVEVGLLRVSPMTALPRKARPKSSSEHDPEMRVWTAEQARVFLAASAGDRWAPMFELDLATGLRRGELVGVRWADVDLEHARLAVRRNRTTVGYAVVETTPKGKRARVVDLDADTVAALKAWRKRQLEERLAWGEAWSDTGLVFSRQDGTAVHPQTAAWHLKRLAKKAGVPGIRLHDLRHTHATLGLAAGVPVKVMSERLGHASVQITLDLYTHVIPGMGADAAAKIGALLRAAQ